MKHESLEKAHTVAQHQLRKLKVLADSCSHCSSADVDVLTQFATRPSSFYQLYFTPTPPPVKGYSALFDQCEDGDIDRVCPGNTPPLAYHHTAYDPENPLSNMCANVFDNDFTEERLPDSDDGDIEECIPQLYEDLHLSSEEVHCDSLWYDYGDIYGTFSSSGTCRCKDGGADVVRRSEVPVHPVECSTEMKDTSLSSGHDDSAATAFYSHVASPGLRSPSAIQQVNESHSSPPSQRIGVPSGDNKKEQRYKPSRERRSSQRDVIFQHRRHSSSTKKRGRRRSSVMTPDLSVLLNSSDASFYSCSSRVPPFDDFTTMPDKSKPLKSAMKTLVLYVMANVFKNVLGRFKRHSR